jgi:hypothetical protein
VALGIWWKTCLHLVVNIGHLRYRKLADGCMTCGGRLLVITCWAPQGMRQRFEIIAQ